MDRGTPLANYLDSLIDRVEDGSLRADLSREITGLRNRKDFGLVFERHLPETIRLYSHPVIVGAIVQGRAEHDGPLWMVRKVVGGKATVERSEEDAAVATIPVKDLVVVRRFGDPMYPGLSSVGRTERGDVDGPSHAVINAENFHALETLLYTLERKVDCIYIDPPYNSGAKDWKYNNDYVDKTDSWRHSKWLSMMERRLTLARRLLAPDATLIIAIDQNEVHHLGMLLEQMFPAARIDCVTIVTKAGGAPEAGFLPVHEYLFFCFFGEANPIFVDDDMLSPETKTRRAQVWRSMVRSGTNARPADRANLVYPIGIDPDRLRVTGTGPSLEERVRSGEVSGDDLNDFEPDPAESVEGSTAVWPRRSDGSLGTWELSAPTMLSLVDSGHVRITTESKTGRFIFTYIKTGMRKKIESGEVPAKGREPDNGPLIVGNSTPTIIPGTVWNRSRHDAGKSGSALVDVLLGERRFEYPKSLYAVYDALKVVVGDKPEATILDFFAGSGTTLHATCLLNSEDGGHRRSVLVTNNEVGTKEGAALATKGIQPGDEAWEQRGIFHLVTRPRCTAAITGVAASGAPLAGEYQGGHTMAEGFRENVEFFKLDYLDPDAVSLGRAFEAIAPLLWLKAGGVGARIEQIAEPWALPEASVYGVLFDPQHWATFVRGVHARAGQVGHVFVVTDSTSVFQQVVTDLPAGTDATMLYEDYLSSFAINTWGQA